MVNKLSLGEALKSHININLYGREVSGLVPPGEIIPKDFDKARGDATFALIRAFEISGFCKALPIPQIFLVQGPGSEVQPDDKCGKTGKELVWEVSSQDESAVFSVARGPIMDLLGDVETKGIDGGISFDPPRIVNGAICTTAHVWAKIEIWGQKAEINEHIPICVPIGGCIPAWEYGIARLNVCFRAPNLICGQLCVGKWGLEKCWDACMPVNLYSVEAEAGCSTTPARADHGCSCSK